ncbi:MAG: T9SS type A sorting domain-containing protein, partial [Clostridia bacterium]|nr:T9SS type A sorting domain-containing protein [Clostridia bacterium]
GSSITERGTVWKTSAGVTITDNKLAEGGTSTGVFSHSRTSLPVGSQIFYRAYATNAIGTTLSDESSFYTLATEPTAHPTGFGATANSSSAITVNWTDATPAADGYLIKGSNVSYGDIAVPVDGTAETNSLLVQNVASGFGTFQFTGLAASTHYFFKIYPYNGSAASINYKTNGTIEEATATTSAYVGPNIWVNEIHYDNDGTDANEFIEVVLENPGSYALSDFAVYLVNGSNGEIYDTKTLDEFTVGTSYGDFTFYSYTYPENGIQNGASDGMAISYQGNLISGQFLSYEGSILGSGGAVDGITSVDIGVSEDGFTPVGYSLQLAGVGTVYSDFVWMAPATNTQGVINNQQSFYAATVWNGSIDTDWGTAGNWSNGIPVLASEVTIPAVTNLPVLSITGSAGDLTIESSAGLTIQTNGSLTVSGTFTNNAGTSGLLLKSDASGTGSLIHSTAGVNASVQRYLSGGWSGWDAGWHQISSPVAAQSISAFATTGAGNGYDLYGWEESTNMWMNYKAAGFEAWNGNSTNFNVGQGYLVSYEAASITQTFTGELNATDETRANLTTNGGSYNGWNLLGNPFASALKWNDGNWTLNNVAGVAKVWSEAGKSYSDIEASTGIIPSAQGFMVQVSSTTSLTIPAVSRVHDATPFFKSGNEKLVLVAAETEGGSAQESKIIVNPMATEGFDFDYDSRFLAGYAPMLYSIVGDESLSTNSLPELATGKVIPLGFVKNAATTFTIELKESIPAHAVYLTDKKTDIVTNLSENPVYSFTSSEGDDPNRFELKFGAVGIDDNIGLEQTSIYSHGQSVFVSSAKSAQAVISIYNITGQQVYANTMVIDGQKQIALNTPTGWYIVKVTTAAGVATQKVFIKSN